MYIDQYENIFNLENTKDDTKDIFDIGEEIDFRDVFPSFDGSSNTRTSPHHFLLDTSAKNPFEKEIDERQRPSLLCALSVKADKDTSCYIDWSKQVNEAKPMTSISKPEMLAQQCDEPISLNIEIRRSKRSKKIVSYAVDNIESSSIEESKETPDELAKDQDTIEPLDHYLEDDYDSCVSSKKQVRWAKDQDGLLFSAFHSLCTKLKQDPSVFKTLKGRMTKGQISLLHALKKDTCWKGTIYCLLTRVKKVINKDSFTARDIRKLRKLLKLEKKGYTTIEAIHENFPGISIEKIYEYKRENMKFVL